jgi:Raf kinase inhibitor-like YbhB/YbcL family protein
MATQAIDVTSPAFSADQPIPPQYTADGDDRSPPLRWSSPPPNTKSFAVVCEDPDAPSGTFVHWLAWNIASDKKELPEGIGASGRASGIVQGKNGFGKTGWAGPKPPPGKPHRYRFHVYALDANLELAPDASRSDLGRAIEGHVLGEGELVGQYGRG